MTGAEAIYGPLLLGAAVGAGTSAVRGGNASNIALSGLAGGATGGFGGWMAAPAAGATVPAATAVPATGSGALGLYASPALGETASAGLGSSFGTGPLSLYASPALGETALATPLSTTAASGLYASPALGETAARGSLFSNISNLGGRVWDEASKSWNQLSKKDIKEAVSAGMLGQEFVGVKKRQPVPPVESIQAVGYEAMPITVKAIPTARAVNPLSQDIVRNYIASLRRR